MIAKAKSISHGINGLNYITGVSANKKHPEKIFHVCDNLLAPGLDPMGIWNSVKLDSLPHPRMRNNIIRMEISPAKEHTENFTMEDWRQLWHDFVTEFDRQEFKGKCKGILSPKTNVAGSKYTVWLHEDAKSGIPHLHAAVSRVDCNGVINNDSNIHLRAQRAAERIARKRGWRTAASVHEVDRQTVGDDCMDVLRQMKEWSPDGYFDGLRAKGYEVHTRPDDDGKIHGYALCMGNAKFKASELGKGRNLMLTKLEGTWKKLHTQTAQHTQTGQPEQKPERKPGQNPERTPGQTPERKPGTDADTSCQYDYTVSRHDTRRVEFPHGDGTYTRFIPEKVMQLFEDEFDYRETENWADLINEACYHFAVAMSCMAFLNAPTYTSGGGGGSSDNDLPKKRDDLEEEMERARRCAQAARSKIGVIRRSRYKR